MEGGATCGAKEEGGGNGKEWGLGVERELEWRMGMGV
jgi:hypothetical protein